MRFTITSTTVELTRQCVDAALAGYQPGRVREYWIEVAGQAGQSLPVTDRPADPSTLGLH